MRPRAVPQSDLVQTLRHKAAERRKYARSARDEKLEAQAAELEDLARVIELQDETKPIPPLQPLKLAVPWRLRK